MQTKYDIYAYFLQSFLIIANIIQALYLQMQTDGYVDINWETQKI